MSASTPIADEIRNESGPAREAPHIEPPSDNTLRWRVDDESLQGIRLNAGRSTAGYQTMPLPDVPNDVLIAFVNAQQVLIQAQHDCLHTANLPDLAAAQHGFILAQARVLEQMGIFGT